jgi:hypothetical protein
VGRGCRCGGEPAREDRRVTVSIPADGPGEVLLPVRGGTEAFAAWSDEPIMRHRRVVVVDSISARSVFVTPVP